MKTTLPYRPELLRQLTAYQARFFSDSPHFFEPPSLVKGPVFLKSKADSNIITHPGADPEGQARVLDLIPPPKRNHQFRTMTSSQALTQSLLGNLKDHGCLSLLAELNDDSGETLFGEAILAGKNLTLEHEVSLPHESAPIRLDGFISGNYRVVLDCRLAEGEVEPCDRPGKCNGSYTLQQGRKHRCAHHAGGATYWDHIPKLFQDWSGREDLVPCPLKNSYQLVRNVLAACTRDDGALSLTNGHAVLLYDNRNPAFQPGGKGFAEFNRVRSGLKRHELLRKCSWQIILEQLSSVHSVRWLAEAINAKYGFLSARA